MTDDQRMKLVEILTRLGYGQTKPTDGKDIVELIEDVRATAYEAGFQAGATHGY